MTVFRESTSQCTIVPNPVQDCGAGFHRLSDLYITLPDWQQQLAMLLKRHFCAQVTLITCVWVLVALVCLGTVPKKYLHSFGQQKRIN